MQRLWFIKEDVLLSDWICEVGKMRVIQNNIKKQGRNRKGKRLRNGPSEIAAWDSGNVGVSECEIGDAEYRARVVRLIKCLLEFDHLAVTEPWKGRDRL